MSDKPVTLAAVTGAHGVTGEVRLKLYTLQKIINSFVFLQGAIWSRAKKQRYTRGSWVPTKGIPRNSWVYPPG